jgi:hypothetical protein
MQGIAQKILPFAPIKKTVREQLHRRSRIEGGSTRITYPTERFDLRSEIVEYIKDSGFTDQPMPLEQLHTRVPLKDQKWPPHNLVNKNNECTNRPSFKIEYEKLIKYLAREVLQRDFLFEKTPLVRLNFSGAMLDRFRAADGRNLSYHSDTLFSDSFEGLSCWMPLTECFGSNAMAWAELEDGISILDQFSRDFDYDDKIYYSEGRKRFFDKLCNDKPWQEQVIRQCSPLEINYGEIMMFDQRCVHGTMENFTNSTRVSMDFRLLLLDDAEALEQHWKSTAPPVDSADGLSIIRGEFYDTRSAFEL